MSRRYDSPCIRENKLAQRSAPPQRYQAISIPDWFPKLSLYCDTPDLAYTVSVLSRHLQAPTVEHIEAAKRVLRYLKQTKTLALTYSPQGNPNLRGFSDSDWAGDKDDRKSTAGYAFILAGAAISWKSKKQAPVATSTTEAEYIGADQAAKEAVWLRQLLADVKQAPPERQLILLDSLSAIKLTENPRYHERSKHIDIKFHHIRDLQEDGQICVDHISTGEMTADILTKPLPRITHQKHVHGMGLN